MASVSHFNPLRLSFHKKEKIPCGGVVTENEWGIRDSCSYFSDCGNKSLVFQKSVGKRTVSSDEFVKVSGHLALSSEPGGCGLVLPPGGYI